MAQDNGGDMGNMDGPVDNMENPMGNPLGGMGGLPPEPRMSISPEQAGFAPLEAQELENQSDAQDLAEELTLLDHRNYAQDDATVERFKEEVLSKLPQIELQREELEALWAECEDIWLRKNNSSSRYYTGINDAYMPTGFRALETHVQHVMSQLFPLTFVPIPKNMLTPPIAVLKAGALLEHDALQAKVEAKFEPFLRQAFIYGWVVEKSVWREERKRNYKLVVDPASKQMALAAGIKPIKTYCGPTFDLIDPYDIYVHPFDVFDIREAQIVHEYFRTSIQKLRQADAELTGNARSPLLNVQRLDTEGKPAERRSGEEKKALRNEKYALRRDQIKDKHERVACQIWFKFDLYGDGNVIDCKALVVDGVVLELRQNPLKIQAPPYRLWSPFNNTRHIYKMGMCEVMRVLVYILNAIINQMLDANLFQTNQMMAIDVNRFQGRPSDIEISPFNVFPMGGIGPVKDAISFFKPEMNLQQTLLAANLMAATIQDSVAASTTMQGKFSGKERTMGEVQMVMQAAMSGVGQMVRSLAVNVLQAWFEDCLELERQYRDPVETMKIAGLPPFEFPFEEREHDYYIRILTTPEAEQYNMAQQQSMAGGQGDNSNPTGVNSQGGTSPEGMGQSPVGNDGGM